MVLKLYGLFDGPPTVSLKQTLEYLQVPHEYIEVNFYTGEHTTEKYALMNPQKEIPVLDDDGFFLSESNAMMQYICEKYKPDSPLYPKDPKARAIVNHRLSFNLSTYYPNIVGYAFLPIFFDCERTPTGLKKVHIALDVFNTYLTRLGTTYAAGDHLTIADFQLINATMGLELIDFDFSKYTKVHKWYNDFKKNHPDLWKMTDIAIKSMKNYITNPPDLSVLNHPIFPAKKVNKS